MDEKCEICGGAADKYVGALRQKIFGGKKNLCKKCLCEKLGCTADYVDELIAYWRARQCPAFV